ncbi:hypothetical protein TorRG33x02_021160, partial [Trema orientale]
MFELATVQITLLKGMFASTLLPPRSRPLVKFFHTIECSLIETIPIEGVPSKDIILLLGEGIIIVQNSMFQ